jgi:hypothetical protein
MSPPYWAGQTREPDLPADFGSEIMKYARHFRQFKAENRINRGWFDQVILYMHGCHSATMLLSSSVLLQFEEFWLGQVSDVRTRSTIPCHSLEKSSLAGTPHVCGSMLAVPELESQ